MKSSLSRTLVAVLLLIIPGVLFAQVISTVYGGYVKDGNLVCYDGYFKTQTGCAKAPDNGWAQGDTWGCNSGYTKGSLQCIEYARVVSDGMFCNSGYVASHGECLYADQAYANDTCIYRYGARATGRPLYDKNVECVCRANYYWNSGKTACLTADELKNQSTIPPQTSYTGSSAGPYVQPLSDLEIRRQSIIKQINALLILYDEQLKKEAAENGSHA